MTTIIATETKDGIKWGWDSSVSNGGSRTETEHRKVFRNGVLVLGVAGSLRDAQLLQFMDVPEFYDSKDGEHNTDRWVSKVLIPTMRETLKESDALTNNQGVASSDSIFLVAVKNRIYQISPYFDFIRRTDGVYAIGSGASFARGALLAGAKFKKALEIASECDSYTGHTICTAKNETLLKD
jgi:ATP-dependent protease HslVU (ClpYQ) peptidase subunit